MTDQKKSLYSLAGILIIMCAIMLAVMFMTGCSPERRIANIVKHNPELVKSDTVFSTQTNNVLVHDSIKLPQVNIDSLIATLGNDTVLIKVSDCKDKIKYVFEKGKLVLDTILTSNFVNDSIEFNSSVHLYTINGELFLTHEGVAKIKVATAVSTITPVQTNSWFHCFIWWTGLLVWVFTLIIIIFTLIETKFKILK